MIVAKKLLYPSETLSGSIIIVAAPSGGGKTSLVKTLINEVDNIELSISHTTRDLRPGEKDGVDYFFVNDTDFQFLIKEKQFIEHAQVFNHFYGTSIVQITERLKAGVDVVLEIDWQGMQQIKKIFPAALAIFIVPPSLSILQQRLLDRRQDSPNVIADRMQRAQQELSHFAEFDYLIVNDDFNKASYELKAIVQANRLRVERQSKQQRQLLTLLLS